MYLVVCFEIVACCNPRLKQAIMSLKSQAEQLLKYLVLSDPVVPYISIPAGILASKLVPSRHLWLFYLVECGSLACNFIFDAIIMMLKG